MYVVVAIGYEERERSEMFDDLLMGFRFRKALQEFLQHEPGAEDGTRFQRLTKLIEFGQLRRSISP